MKLRPNERIELENALGTLARIEKRSLSEEGTPRNAFPGDKWTELDEARIDIARARGAIETLLKEEE